jgi:hypothetical protein
MISKDDLFSCVDGKTQAIKCFHPFIRVSELSASEAAAAVVLLPSVLKDSDARDDAADVVDELLAVCEGGLGSVSPSLLHGLSSALACLGHIPDAIWSSSFEAEVARRVHAAGDVIRVDSVNKGRSLGPDEGIVLERQALVHMVSALSSLPRPKSQSSPSLGASDLTSFSNSLVAAGSRLGGFDDDQLLDLHTGLKSIGFQMTKVKLPVADSNTEPDPESDPAGSPIVASHESGHAAASEDGERTEEEEEPEPELFLGYAHVKYDLEGLLRAVKIFKETARRPGSGPPGGEDGHGTATRNKDRWSGSANARQDDHSWYGSEGALRDSSWEVPDDIQPRRSRNLGTR